MKAVVAQKTVDKVTANLTEDYPNPIPRSNDLLIKILVSPIQPSDNINATGGFPNTQFPRVLGRDYAGIVVGPDASPLKGKIVYGTSGNEGAFLRDGAHAELMAVPADAVVEAPEGLDAKQVGALGTPWSTACLALKRARVQQGEYVVITGAGGSVGAAAVQLTKEMFNANVIRVGRGDNYDVPTTKDTKLETIRKLTGGKGADVVFDTTGDIALIEAGYAQLGHGGRLVIITTGPSRASTSLNVDLKALYRGEKSIVGCNSVEHSAAYMAELFRKMNPLFESGKLTPPDLSRWDQIKLADAGEAYEELANGSRKKFVIVED